MNEEATEMRQGEPGKLEYHNALEMERFLCKNPGIFPGHEKIMILERIANLRFQANQQGYNGTIDELMKTAQAVQDNRGLC